MEDFRSGEGEGGKDWGDRSGERPMDEEELRRVMRSTGVDLWTLIETAIDVAARDHGKELQARRDGIVERLYSYRCQNCSGGGAAAGLGAASLPRGGVEGSPPSMNGEVREVQNDHSIDERTKILAIKEFLEDPDQPQDSLLSLLRNLADMEVTFQALKETDIGRHVNGFRKHPSAEVRQLVKQLVRRWKDTVDEWVKSNSAGGDTTSPANITDGDSPQQIPVKNNKQNGHHQAPDFGCSPNSHDGHGSDERDGGESLEAKPKPKPAPRKEAPAKPNHSSPPTAPSPPAKVKGLMDSLLDPERLAEARKRLHENYQEAQNAKRQRTVQVMGIHEIPKPKNSFVRNKGGAKRW